MSPRKSEAWKKGRIQEICRRCHYLTLPSTRKYRLMETLDDTRGEFFKKCLRQKCIQKKCPWLASQPAVFFLLRLQGLRPDTKIKFHSFPLIFFISSEG